MTIRFSVVVLTYARDQILADTLGQDIEVLKASPMYSYLPDLAPQPDQLENMQQV